MNSSSQRMDQMRLQQSYGVLKLGYYLIIKAKKSEKIISKNQRINYCYTCICASFHP